MSDKFDLLQTLSDLSYRLRCVGMEQASADYDYMIAWMRSPLLNNGVHLKPHPAGKNTIDVYSNNCPIPYDDYSYATHFTDNKEIIFLLKSANDIINEISSKVTDSIESNAISAYREYTDNVLSILDSNYVPSHPQAGEILTAYFSAKQTPINITKSYYYYLYEPSGSRLMIEQEYEYIPLKYILSDGSEILIPSEYATKAYLCTTSNQGSGSSMSMSIYHTYSSDINNIVSLAYEKRPANLITAWLSNDKTPIAVNQYPKYLYDKDGNRIAAPSSYQVVAYYYVNGERIYNGDRFVTISVSDNHLAIGAKSSTTIEKVEYVISPLAEL